MKRYFIVGLAIVLALSLGAIFYGAWLNERGEYLQALVWLGFLFGVDPCGVAYVSPHVGDADARFLRECARDALAAAG